MRRLLLATTALLAPSLAEAQVPSGGTTVAGAATITQTPTRTQVNQTTGRAVIEWRGFDIGPTHQVDIRQPSPPSWSLQRVTGPDPSAIAGRLTSNGGVAITNPNGVTFMAGAQVDVASLIATASTTTNASFMAGRLAFDGAPRPGARVENHGTITVRDAGLAALVAPHAANRGTINARLGRVAIAGGTAVTLDLGGDGLLSLDITGTGLATNAGTIAAEGGQVLLTARAASDVIEHVVTAGGAVTAATVTANAPGAGILVPAGSTLDASGQLTVGAAATSRIGAPQNLSARTTVAPGATLRGDSVIVHAADRTEMRGTVRAREAEISSRRALALDGTLDAGRVLVDPDSLHIVAALSGSTEPAEITAATIAATPGALTLSADRAIRVRAPVTKATGPLTLETTGPGDGISIERTLNVTGDLVLRSGGDITQSARILAGTLFAESRAGAVRLDAGTNAIRALAGGAAATRFDVASALGLPVDGPVTAGSIRLTSGNAMALRAPLTSATTTELTASRGISQDAAAPVTAATLSLDAPNGAVALEAANRVATLADATARDGLAFRNAASLNLAGTVAAPVASFTLDTGSLTQSASSRLLAERLRVTVPNGAAILDSTLNAVARLSGSARDAVTLDAGRSLTLDGPVRAASVTLSTRGDLTQETDALLITGLLRAAATGAVALQDPLNIVDALGASAAGTAFSLATSGTLRLAGPLTAPEVTLTPGGSLVQTTGTIAADRLRINAITGDVALDGPGNRVAALLPSGAARSFALASDTPLDVTGPLDAGGGLALSAPALRLAANLDAPAATLRATAGDVTQDAGRIATPELRAEAAGEVRLDAVGNAVAAVSGRAGTAYRLSTTTALRAGDLAAPEVTLAAGGAITQTPAGIAADLLHLSSGGTVSLEAQANAIRALGTVTARGLALRTSTALQLTAPLALPSLGLTTGGALTQSPFATIRTDSLTLSSAGPVTLDAPGNAISTLRTATVAGDLTLATSGTLALFGSARSLGTMTLTASGDLRQLLGFIQAPILIARAPNGSVILDGPNLVGAAGGTAAATWRLNNADTADLRLAGLLAAPEVALTLAGGLSESTGALRTQVLALDIAGTATLESANHRVAALSGRAGALRLAAGGPLDITGPLDISGALALQAERIAILVPVAASGPALLLALSGDVTQSATGAGLTLGAGLTAHAAGAVALAGAGNTVPSFGGSAGAGLALATAGPLTLPAEIAAETITVSATGPMTLDGTALRAGRAVLLAAPGGLVAGPRATLAPLDPARLPVLILDTRAAGLAAIPPGLAPDLPGLPAAAQPTQLAAFGPVGTSPAAGAAFDIAAGGSPVFLLLDGAPAVGTIEAGRLGLLARGGSAFLVGTLGGTGGAAAAALVSLPATEAGYQLNGCPMGLSGCGAPAPPPPAEGPSPVPPPPVPPPPGRPAPGRPPPVQGTPEGTPKATSVGADALLLRLRPDDPSPWAPWPASWPLPPLLRDTHDPP